MANKQAAVGTIVKLDHDDDASFDVVGLVSSVTPAGRSREEIDGKDLGDTLDVPILGIEEKSEFVFTQFWHPGDTEHEKIDTLFDSKNERSVQLVTPHATPVTDEFTMRVSKIEPEELTTGGTFKRAVTMIRTGAITRT